MHATNVAHIYTTHFIQHGENTAETNIYTCYTQTQYKSKLRVYRKLKWEIGFEECLEYVKGVLSRWFINFSSGTHGLFEELGQHDKKDGSQECPNCGACKESVEHVPFECTSYASQRLDFLDHLKTVLRPDAFETIPRGSIFDKTAFCIGEKEGMLVNDECSSGTIESRRFFSINLEKEKTAIVHRRISMHDTTNQPHSSGVYGQWH